MKISNNKSIIIGLTGNKGVGKDTVGEYIINKYKYNHLSFAEPLKNALKHLFNLTDEQLHDQSKKEEIDEYWKITPRQLMQFIGTEVFRDKIKEILPEIGNNFWINLLNKKITEGRYIITDVRFENESEYIREKGGIIIKIRREIKGNEYNLHSSEDGINEDKCTYIVENNGTIEELYERIEEIIKKIEK